MATYNQIKKRLANNNGSKEAPEKSDASFFERAWDTVLDFGTNVVAGGSQAVEGIVDAGIGIAGLFAGKEKKQEYAERIMNDWTGKHILNPMEKHTSDSYLNNNKIGETVENVAQGVGQMLPSVALSAIPYVGKALSMTSLFMRGVGSGMQESLSEGATYNQAFGYGALSGSVELLTEGISAKLFGANAVDKGYGIKEILGKALFKSEKSGLLKLAQDVAGEGLEEGISEFVNPLLKLTYKSLNETDFLSSEHIQRTIDSAVVGGLTSLVFKGTVGQLPAIKNSSKLADLQDQIIEYNDLSGKFYEDATSGKISAEEFAETEKQFNIRRNQIETEMSKILQEFGDATRQKILDRNAFLGQRFNSDGSVVQQDSNGTDLGVRAYNRDAYSVLDVNKEDSFVYKPSQTLSESAQETKQMIAQLSKAKGQPISYVFTDELNVKEKGGYKDGVIYINNRLQGSEMMTEVLKHEFTHSLENTKAYRQYSLFVLKTLLNNSTIATQLGIDVNADLKRLYDIYSKHGEINSSDPEIKQANILLSEIVAKYSSEKLFTDQESINRICQTNPNLAQRIIRWIKDAIARFSGKTKAERETIAFLRKAERMYTRAIENAIQTNDSQTNFSLKAGYNPEIKTTTEGIKEKYGIGSIYDINEVSNKVADKLLKTFLTSNGVQKYIKNIDSGVEVTITKAGIKETFGNKKYYINYPKKLKLAKIASMEHLAKMIKYGEIKEENVKNYHNEKSPTTFTYLKSSLNIDGVDYNVDIVIKLTKEGNRFHIHDLKLNKKSEVARNSALYNKVNSPKGVKTTLSASSEFTSIDNNVSQNDTVVNNKYVQSQKNNTDKMKMSLVVDSEGNNLTEAQAEFFKDSKVRDEDGNLLVVYHGTDADFNVFDKSKNVEGNNAFWFSKSKEYAEEMAIVKEGKRVDAFYLDIKNPLKVKLGLKDFADNIKEERFIKQALENNNDGVIFEEDAKDGDTFFAVFNSNQIKNTTNKNPTKSNDIRFSLSDSVEDDVLKEFGRTWDWREVGYIYKDGTRLDLSGKKRGARGGSRTVDHREIFDIYDDAEDYGTDAMNEFIQRGNIRVAPEYPGINLQVEPTVAQYEEIQSLVERLGWKEKSFSVDISDKNGYTLETLEYDGAVSGRKVVADIKYYFKEGKAPYKSELSGFRYSLDDDIWDEIFDSPEEQVDEKVALEQGKRTTDEIKLRAKLKQSKVYSKEELRQLVSDAIGETPLTLKGKTREEVVSALFERMNTQDKFGKQETAEKIADYIIKNSQIDNFDYESVISAQTSRNKILKYLHGIYLNREVKAEIRHLFGKAGDGIILAWGNKEGVEPFTVRAELISDGVIISKESINDADIFMDIYNAYIEARDIMQHLKETAKMYATELLTEEELKSFKQSLSEQILNAYNEKGSETQISKLLDNNNKIIKKLTKRILDTRAYAKSYVDFMTIQKKAKELLNKKYSASILEDEKVKAFLKVVSKATNIKTISKNARDYVRSLAEVYNKENHVFNITTEDDNLGNVISSPSDFDQNLADMIDYIATGEGSLTTQDLQIFTKITAGIIHLYKNYDAVIKNGVAVKTEDLAVRYIEDLQEANKIRNSKGLLKLIWKIRQAIDPHAVFRNMDGYKVKFNKDLGINEDVGFFSEAYKEITDGEVKSAVAELELLKDFEEFFKNNKTFKKDLTKKMLKLKCKQVEGDKIHDTAEIEVPLDEAIAIYLTEQRPQANFYNTTIVLENKKGELVKYEVHKKDFDEFAKQFSVLEKQYIKLVKDFFNVKAKNLKVETDNSLYGYTNIEEGDTYYPIKRESYSIAKNIGDEPNVSEVLTLWNLSFNKEVIKNAKLPLRINGVQTTIQNHARAMSLYYGLAIPLRNFNRVYNKSIKYSKHPISIRQITGEKMRGGEEYIRKLFNDLQGIRNDYSIGSKILRKARGLYAQYQLGFNLKTVMGQTSSYLMGVNYLDADALAKGLTVKTKKADLLRYNKFARFRIEDKTIVKAEGVIDKVSKIGDIATKPIQWMDNNVVLKLWGACQVQIEKNTGYKVGTQDNLERAGKLLEVVVRETQSNSIMTEKTGLSRHQNELIASMTMFSSDAQKQLSRIIDGLGYKLATQERVKAGLLSKNAQEYKTASKQWIRATSGFILSSTMYVLIGMLFKWLLGKRDEEESLPEEFLGDFASQVAGLIPIFRDVYGYFENDYEINNYAFSMVNDMLSAVKDMWGLVDGIISGKELSKQDIAKPIRTSLYAIGMGTGMPVRNVYNYIYGLTSKFSPATAYKMNSLFYAPKVKDLDSAIENGNEKQSLAVVKELYQSRNLKLNDAYYNETLRLYKQGENIIPGKISETISYNGETFELEEKQHKQLIEVANNSLTYISDTLNDKTYNNLTDKEKASYVNNLYKINYVTNLLDIIGEDRLSENDTKKYLFAKCFSKDNDMLKHMAYVISMKSDKDKNGNTIYNSRKNKIVKYINSLKVSSAEKYLLMACAGFKNKNGEQQVKSYISKKGLTKEERDKIMEYCGY